MSGVKVASLLLPWFSWQNSKISIDVSVVLDILLPWPSDLFCFNTLIILLIFLYWREVVVVHAKDYLTLMATEFEWTVYDFSFICLQNIDAAKLSIAGRIFIVKCNWPWPFVMTISIGLLVLDN